MKKLLFLVVLAFLLLLPPSHTTAADSSSGTKWEYAIVKWDGPDKLYYNLPDKFELVLLGKTGVTVPKEAQPEEWCLNYAANKLAKDGWETLTLNSRRILLRRPAR
jgi:hypothetical protein